MTYDVLLKYIYINVCIRDITGITTLDKITIFQPVIYKIEKKEKDDTTQYLLYTLREKKPTQFKFDRDIIMDLVLTYFNDLNGTGYFVSNKFKEILNLFVENKLDGLNINKRIKLYEIEKEIDNLLNYDNFIHKIYIIDVSKTDSLNKFFEKYLYIRYKEVQKNKEKNIYEVIERDLSTHNIEPTQIINNTDYTKLEDLNKNFKN